MFEEDMYVVIAFDKTMPQGEICSVAETGNSDFASKKVCKAFIKSQNKRHPSVAYEMYKMKFKETI